MLFLLSERCISTTQSIIISWTNISLLYLKILFIKLITIGFFFNLSTKLIKTFSKTVIEPIINSFSWLTIISLIRDGCGCKDGIINTERNDIRHVCGKPNTIRKITNYIVHRWIQFILLFRANSPSFFA